MENSSEPPDDPCENITNVPEDVDTSMFPFPSAIWEIRPTSEVVLKVVTLMPIVLVGIFGNFSLIHVIIRSKQLRSTTTNLLILNMAIADLCTSLFGPGLFISVDIFQNYQFGDIGCRFDGFLLQALTLVAVFSLSAVSYDRVCAIVLNCSGKLSIRNARFLIMTSWVVALMVAVPLAFFRWQYVRIWKNWTEKFCAETKTAWPYWHLFVGVSVWIPLAVMALCYTTILIKLDRYEHQALKSKHPIVVNYKGRVAKVLSLVVLAFILCRVPFTALVIRRAQLKVIDDYGIGQAQSMYILWYTSRYLIFVNAALNPLLYGCTSGSLRQELASYPPLFWIILRKEQDKSKPSQSPHKLNTLKPRSPCGMKFDNNNDVRLQVPNISSTVQTKNSESKLFKKLRIDSIMNNFGGSKNNSVVSNE